MKPCFFLLVILATAASGCVLAPTQTIPTPGAAITVTMPPIPTPTNSARPAATLTSTPTATPPPTVTPTLEPNLPDADPPEIAPGAVISPANAAQVVELAGWGEGYDFNLFFGMSQIASDGRVLIQKEIASEATESSGPIIRTRFWDLPAGELHLELVHPHDYSFLIASADGSRYAIYYDYCRWTDPKPCVMEVWSLPENELLLTLDPGPLTTGLFSPDNRLLALSTENGIAIWGLDTGELVRTLTPAMNLDILRFSHEGRLLAGTQYMGTGTVTVWQVEDGQQAASLVSQGYPSGFSPDEMAFSPDDSTLVMGFGTTAVPWKTSDWSEGPPWNWSSTHGISELAFSPDGRLIASGGSDGSIVLADPATGKLLATWDAHTDETYDPIYYLVFSPDGTLLMSLSADMTLRFWGMKEE